MLTYGTANSFVKYIFLVGIRVVVSWRNTLVIAYCGLVCSSRARNRRDKSRLFVITSDLTMIVYYSVVSVCYIMSWRSPKRFKLTCLDASKVRGRGSLLDDALIARNWQKLITIWNVVGANFWMQVCLPRVLFRCTWFVKSSVDCL